MRKSIWSTRPIINYWIRKSYLIELGNKSSNSKKKIIVNKKRCKKNIIYTSYVFLLGKNEFFIK